MKKSINKLCLNKTTISNLSQSDLGQINGGNKQTRPCAPPPTFKNCPSFGMGTCSACNCTIVNAPK
ncbi:MAG: class I lanthipeptide [Bacteroidetes bacterium]|nr:class I lanthipeptide [Bacteroidota bacterium]